MRVVLQAASSGWADTLAAWVSALVGLTAILATVYVANKSLRETLHKQDEGLTVQRELTDSTMQHQRGQAREALLEARRLAADNRIWERRADLYVALLAWVNDARAEVQAAAVERTAATDDAAQGEDHGISTPTPSPHLRAQMDAFASQEVREAFHQVLPRVTRAPGARSAAAVARLKALGDRGLALGAEWAQDRPPPATSDQSAFPLVLPLALQAAGLVWRKIENLQSYEDALLHLTSTVRDELQLGVVKR